MESRISSRSRLGLSTRWLATLTVLLAAPLSAQQVTTPAERAAARGQNKIIVVKTPGKPVDVKPDLLFYKDGRIFEVFDLTIQRQSVRYTYYDENEQPFTRDDHKHRILAIQFSRTLKDYLADQNLPEEPATPAVAPAEKQPVKKEEVLAGTYFARQGRFTRWTATFTSQLHKYYEHARNATEYGTFVIKSHMLQPVPGEERHENEVLAKGQYFLYAPGVFGNENWVLNLTRVAYTEHDISPRRSIYTERLRDEIFILNLSRDRNVFSLEWANQEGWQWTSPTQQTFYRARSQKVGRGGSARIDDGHPFRSLKRALGLRDVARREDD